MGHWYDKKTGEPRYTVPYADVKKGERATTLGDAKKLGLVPSVTTITSLLDKPALVTYKQNQILNTVIKAPYSKEVDEQRWRNAILSAAGDEARKAAERGNELHNALELYFKTGTVTHGEFVEPVIKKIEEQFPGVKWVAERSFANREHGFGGKIDLHSSDEIIILDFKTKNTADLKKMVQYDEHHMQTSAYSVGITTKNTQRYNLFISTHQPGLLSLLESPKTNKHWAMFEALLTYWKLANNFEEHIR